MKLRKRIKHKIECVFWSIFVRIIYHWSSRYLDQWEKFCFDTENGKIYVTISRNNEFPRSFDYLNKDGTPHKNYNEWLMGND